MDKFKVSMVAIGVAVVGFLAWDRYIEDQRASNAMLEEDLARKRHMCMDLKMADACEFLGYDEMAKAIRETGG